MSATGEEPRTVRAQDWLGALGTGLAELGLLEGVERLACERMPNGTVVARDVRSGRGFVVQPGDGDLHDPTPAPAPRRGENPEAFGVQNLPASVFQANLSHELRTPLNDIVGYTGLLLEDAADLGDPRMVDDVRRVNRAADDLLDLISACLDAARFEAGNVEITAHAFFVTELLEDVAAAFAPDAERGGNRVAVRAGHLGSLVADANHLRFALLESLRWLAADLENGVLVLDGAAEPDDGADVGWVVLEVSSSGPELGDHALRGLFEIFAHGNARAGAAAAVRRAQARELIRAMGGDIGVARRAERSPVIRIRMPQLRLS